MATLNEISLILGLIASGLFYYQYKKYEAEAEKEEMINSFLNNWNRFKIQQIQSWKHKKKQPLSLKSGAVF